ncbi:hypothetical protein [Aureimonas ureilytica]|uniref:hypothetical protein n=1 Tax=Aureimonas ureilytica TaxID=401562 RepID=UPI00035D2DC0|nr:hypothetical protein [Aureimonas ureilytica]
MNTNEYTPVARLFQDARLRAAFSRIERDASGALVLPKRPEPVLIGGAAAELEAA